MIDYDAIIVEAELAYRASIEKAKQAKKALEEANRQCNHADSEYDQCMQEMKKHEHTIEVLELMRDNKMP